MLTDYLENWTADDTRAVDRAYAKMANEEPLTNDEIKLISRFETAQALADAKYQLEMDLMREKCQQDMEQSRKEHELAMEVLHTNAEAARERYRQVSNGQE